MNPFRPLCILAIALAATSSLYAQAGLAPLIRLETRRLVTAFNHREVNADLAQLMSLNKELRPAVDAADARLEVSTRKQMLDLLQKRLGTEHWIVCTHRRWLASAERAAKFAEDSPYRTGRALLAFGRRHGDEQRLAAAIVDLALAEEALACQSSDVVLLDCKFLHARALYDSGRHHDARSKFAELLALARALYDPRHPEVAVALTHLGSVELDRRQAQECFEQAIDILDDHDLQGSHYAFHCRTSLAQILAQSKQHKEAARLAAEALACARQRPLDRSNEWHELELNCQAIVAHNLIVQRKFEAARVYVAPLVHKPDAWPLGSLGGLRILHAYNVALRHFGQDEAARTIDERYRLEREAYLARSPLDDAPETDD